MLIVLPVCVRDAQMAIQLGRWMSELGTHQFHSLAILFDSEVSKSDCEELRRIFYPLFGSVESYVVSAPTGWPDGPNEMFKVAAMIARPHITPWYFFEPDNAPTRSGWLDELAGEYYGSGRPFLGALAMEYLEPTPGQLFPIGRYLMGSAIYPPDLGHYTVVFSLAIDKPFDLAMKPFLMDQSVVRESTLIANRWNTSNYRMDGQDILCDQHKLREGQTGSGLAIKITSPLPAVIHGCKDGTLVSLLRLIHAQTRIVSPHDAQESPCQSGKHQRAVAIS